MQTLVPADDQNSHLDVRDDLARKPRSFCVPSLRSLIPGLASRRRDAGPTISPFLVAGCWASSPFHIDLLAGVSTADSVSTSDHAPFDVYKFFWKSLPWLLGVKLLVFYASGHYHGWWRYVTFSDLTALMRASVMSFLVLAAADYFVAGLFHVPRGVLILDALLSIVVLGSLRASWRLAREQFRAVVGTHDCTSVLMVGTDDTTALLAHQIQTHAESKYRVCGFLETNGAPTRGRRLGQITVVGHVRDVASVASERGVGHILMLSGSLPGHQLRELMAECDKAGLELKIIPRVEDLFQWRSASSDSRYRDQRSTTPRSG